MQFDRGYISPYFITNAEIDHAFTRNFHERSAFSVLREWVSRIEERFARYPAHAEFDNTPMDLQAVHENDVAMLAAHSVVGRPANTANS